jgi:NAD(P)-dependent dehydrogenase (short-subunit alcohol dehydrogenase family)
MKAALATFNVNLDGGAFIITSSIVGIRPNGSSMPYSVTEAAQLHLMKCLAATRGPKVRVHAMLPGLLLAELGQLYGEEMVKQLEERAWLKKVVNGLFFFLILCVVKLGLGCMFADVLCV